MSRSNHSQWFSSVFRHQRVRRAPRLRNATFEQLGARLTPAVTAFFAPSAGLLTVFGDTLDNNIQIARNAGGNIIVNGGAVAISGGTPTVANTALIQVFGLNGNDQIALNQANGALPAANIFGGAGNDTLTGGSGNDLLFGQSGNDTLLGKSGFDQLFGGADNDTLTGGDDDDQVFGESGNDRMIWNPGDDTDLNEGGDGNDTVEVIGGNGAEIFTATANGTRVRFDRLSPAPFSIDIGTSENLVLNANGGDDMFSATGDLAALISITVDGGAGNDTILGSNGRDLLMGGSGNDFIDGQQGNDTAFLGAGDDTFQWDPGDGSDTVEGQDGFDTMQFNGSDGAEIFELTANGPRLRFTRNLGNIVMDTNDVEKVNVAALGNADQTIVNDLSGTDVVEVAIDLAGTLGGALGDGVADSVIVNGTNGPDSIGVVGAGTNYAVTGLSARVSVRNSQAAHDSLTIQALGGNDTVSAVTLAAGVVKLTIDGGTGDDTILGSAGADVLLGGEGVDVVDGNVGNDVAFLGAGNDIFTWDPGDGSDTVEGQAGFDTLQFNGSPSNENFDLFASLGRVKVFRSVGNYLVDTNDLEKVNLAALGGADNIVIGDLSGTDVTEVNLLLAGAQGGNAQDGQPDSVTVNGTAGADSIIVSNAAGIVTVAGLPAVVKIKNSVGPQDKLIINALGDDDVVDASNLPANLVDLVLNGGLGDDVFIGSPGNDFFNGGDGDDFAFMGAGNDTFVWNPGDDNDTLEGQAGTDTMLFNGAIIAEQIDIVANGGRVLFFRDIANVVMDLNDVEVITFNALGGADNVEVNDLSGTDVTTINLNLAGTIGGAFSDGQPDTVIVQGTNGDDVALVTGNANGVSVLGLAATVNITRSDAALDRLIINGLAGDDVIEASGLAAGAILLTENGGEDDDVLIGSDGADTLQGDAGDDVLVGGLGVDVLNGGDGSDIEIQG